MQKFGLIKSKKSTKRAVLGAGAFTAQDDDEEEEAQSGVNSRGKGAIVAANRALTSYVAASATATATSVEAVDASVYDYDGAIDRRDELKKSASTGVSGTGIGGAGGHGSSAGAADVPASSYIGGLLKTAQRRDKEKEIVHEKKLLKDRQAEDALYGDLPKFVTSAYKAKLEADEAFKRETAMADAATGDVSTSGMKGFYGGVLLAARGLGGSAEFSSASTSHALDEEPPAPTPASTQPIAHKRVSRFIDADDDLPMSHAQIAYSNAGSSHSEHKCALSEAQLKAQEKAVQDTDAETIATERALRMLQVAMARERYFERRDTARAQQV